MDGNPVFLPECTQALVTVGLLALEWASGGIALAYNARTRDEVDKVLAEAEAAGAKILKPAHEAFWGGYSGYFADPDSFLWEVAWNPSFANRRRWQHSSAGLTLALQASIVRLDGSP